jgi:CheY-like chemotaxis protein
MEENNSKRNIINHVLYIEDNYPSQQLMQRYFDTIEASELHVADNAEKGWDMVLQYVFDLILMDINLPGISGRELTQQLKNTPEFRHIPIVAVTAVAPDSDNNAELALFDDYLMKPLFFDDLVPKLTKYINTNF